MIMMRSMRENQDDLIIIIIWMMRMIMMKIVRMATTLTRMAGCNRMYWAATVLC